MIFFRRVFRLTRLIAHLLSGVLQTIWLSGIRGLAAKHPDYQVRKQRWLAAVMEIIGGDVQVFGTPATNSTLMVANHISWLDICLLGGYAHVDFLSKAEVRHWPIIGWLAEKSGTLFIERGGKDAARAATDVIAARLREKGNVLVFPEGTTSDGQQLRTFHARLFAGAIEAQSAIQPVAIRYLTQNGQVNLIVPYIDQQTLMVNLWQVLAEQAITIELHFLTVLSSHEQARKALAQWSEALVRQIVSPKVPSPHLVLGDIHQILH